MATKKPQNPELEQEKQQFAEIVKKTRTSIKVLAGSPTSTLGVGELYLECYVVVINGVVKRIVARADVQRLFMLDPIRGTALEEFFQRKNINSYISKAIIDKIKNPFYGVRKGRGSKTAFIDAEILPDLCSAALEWRRTAEIKGELETISQKDLIAIKQSEIILSGIAKTGIIALIDEATGYQKQKDEYHQFLNQFINEKFRDWSLMFTENWFKQVYRLYGWNWNNYKVDGKNHPQIVSWVIKKIYEKLPYGQKIFQDIKDSTPRDEKGNAKFKHHQKLTDSGREYLSRLVGKSELVFQQTADEKKDMTEALRNFDAVEPNPNLPPGLFDNI